MSRKDRGALLPSEKAGKTDVLAKVCDVLSRSVVSNS